MVTVTATGRALRIPPLAPLTTAEAVHLASYRLRHTPLDVGRPAGRSVDLTLRYEQRLLAALESLVPAVTAARRQVYQLIDDELRQAGKLSPSWLLRTLSAHTPHDKIVYPQRLTDWQHNGVLHYMEAGQPDMQCAAGILVARLIDPRNNGWLPTHLSDEDRRTSWSCLLQATRDASPVPYALPLPGEEQEGGVQAPGVSLCWTPWKGARWMGWEEVDGGAIGWFPQQRVTYDLLREWDPELPRRDEPPDAPALPALSTAVLRRLAGTRLPPGPPAPG